ncbi:DUF1800 domain-containing protein [Chitinophaga barathri]|uniref:DUF1800 domain-containing protein n=1 Tax=Chitinophaga barathri TaxID=1647451 RepID=A0A3N4MDK3_9BACT|nr:DUF1800 domain-containing protein [Chitinophaga barathri]RPD40026.1 DUF1800 domain-containing protein [Chitinophaga barathri]
MAVVPEQIQLQHLGWRAGFGENPEVIRSWAKKRRKEVVRKVILGPNAAPESIKVMDETDLPDFRRQRNMGAEERKAVQKMNTDGIKDLNVMWTHAMINSGHPLQEKMALFWHGHFACRTQNVLFNQQLLQVIRQHGLGNFGTLLTEVSKTPAMLAFLNNQQNRKQRPNENFAREVMELFTLGRGNYTEKDIKEAARAFTGWGYNEIGQFQFRKNLHDEGNKTVLGKTGMFDGDDVIKILLEQKQTARYITAKIYRYFVNETEDDARIDQLAAKFYQSNYDLRGLMQEIFMADWFYEEKHIGSRIKSPVELIVGLRRSIPMQFEQEEAMLVFQRVMGQTLFYPPNVAGWPGGRSWIDSSSLMFRMRVPQIILYSQEFNIRPKEITPEMGEGQNYKMTMQVNEFLKKQYARRVNANVDWAPFLESFKDTPREKLADQIAGSLLLKNSGIDKQLLEKYSDNSSRENYIKTVTIDVMSTPEYQLC